VRWGRGKRKEYSGCQLMLMLNYNCCPCLSFRWKLCSLETGSFTAKERERNRKKEKEDNSKSRCKFIYIWKLKVNPIGDIHLNAMAKTSNWLWLIKLANGFSFICWSMIESILAQKRETDIFKFLISIITNIFNYKIHKIIIYAIEIWQWNLCEFGNWERN